MRLRLPVLLLVGAALPAACSDDGTRSQPEDAVTDRDSGAPASDVTEEQYPGVDLPPLPALVSDCGTCHDQSTITAPPQAEPSAPRGWMAERGRGLARFDPAIPEPGTKLTLAWTERGHHDAAGSGGCAACHPVRDDGVGHGVRTYPSLDSVFDASADCARSCHAWLPEDATGEGYEDDAGQSPRYEGTLRPGELLAAADNGHARLWREGARPPTSTFKVGAFNAGCGGCHNLAAEAHGNIPSCLDCHRFGDQSGEVHKLHVSVIAENADKLDVEAAAAGATFCTYCHTGDEDSGSRARTACYGCHLSAHQPLDEDGRAHFWPIR